MIFESAAELEKSDPAEFEELVQSVVERLVEFAVPVKFAVAALEEVVELVILEEFERSILEELDKIAVLEALDRLEFSAGLV